MNEDNSKFVLNFISDCYAAQGLDHILNTAYKYFGNPCSIYDVSLNTIGHIGDESLADSFWQETVRDGHLSKETIASFMNKGWMNSQYDILYQMFTATLFDPTRPTESVRRLAIAIPSKDGTHCGWFSVFEHDRAFKERDFELTTWLAKILSPQIEGLILNKVSSAGRIENVLIDILNDSVKMTEIEDRLSLVGWKTFHYNRILLIRSEDSVFPKAMREFIKQSVLRYTTHFSSFMYNGFFVVVLCSNDDIFGGSFYKEIRNTLAQFHLQGALSRLFHNISELKRHYIQALDCIHICRLKGIHDSLVLFEDYAIDIMILRANQYFDLQNYCHPLLLDLQKYDQAQNTSFFNSLRQYVLNNGNLKAAAQDLQIHRNTLKYRIEKAQEVMGVDTFDQKLLSDLYISFIIYDTIRLDSDMPADTFLR